MSPRRSALAAAATAVTFVAVAAPASAAQGTAVPAPSATAAKGLRAAVGDLLGGALTPVSGTLATATAPAALPIDPATLGGGTLPIGGDLLSPLQGVVTTLTGLAPGGTAPTGGQLAPVTALLRQLAGLPGIDGLVGATLTQLADQIDAQGGSLPAGLLTTLTGTLQSVTATPGVPEPVTTVVTSITTLLGASTGTPAPAGSGTNHPPAASTTTPGTTKAPAANTTTPGATKAPATTAGGTGGNGTTKKQIGRVRISSARVDRKRGTVRITLSCPATGPDCKTLLGVARGTTLQSSTGILSIRAGGSVTRTLKLRAASRRLIRTKTTKFVVGALLPDGRFAARTVTARAPKVKKPKPKQAAARRR